MEIINKQNNGEEVISLENREDNILFQHSTYTVEEFLSKLEDKVHNYDNPKIEKWFEEGVNCKMLSPNQNWQKGKIKICLQFIPDRPESVLDDIRESNQ